MNRIDKLYVTQEMREKTQMNARRDTTTKIMQPFKKSSETS